MQNVRVSIYIVSSELSPCHLPHGRETYENAVERIQGIPGDSSTATARYGFLIRPGGSVVNGRTF
jgi:hypothetical protein